MKDRIYLDHAATTPVHPEVLAAMMPYFTQVYGNPSSIHSFGREARVAVNRFRDRIAELLDCEPQELVFTGSGSESDNLAVLGALQAMPAGGHLVTTSIEHHAVLNTFRHLEGRGYDVTYLPADSYGRVDPAWVEAALRPDTRLVSVMYANNEVGTLQPVETIGRIVRERGILFHCDAVQALGSIPIRLSQFPVDLMSFSAHKIRGPKGIGLLYVRDKTALYPLIHGGSQERRRRAGTENVPGIAGLAKALELAVGDLPESAARLNGLRSHLLDVLRSELGEEAFVVNGHPTERLPHILNVSFPGISAETMLMNLDLEGIAASAGSACTAGSLEPSHVLRAMGLPEERVQSAIRFSFGSDNVHDSVTIAGRKIATIVKRLRNRK
jgi:cysteine desulfurase